MGATNVVSLPNARISLPSNHSTKHCKYPPPSAFRQEAPAQSETKVDCLSYIRKQYESQGISEDAINLITASWRPSTQALYRTYIAKWYEFCSAWDINPLSPPLANITEFLTIMFHEGKSYSTINTARSSLSSLGIRIDGVPAGAHPTISR